MTFGIPYASNVKNFPAIYKKIYETEFPKHLSRNHGLEDPGMMSSQDLLMRKKLKMDDINYHTQDRENLNYDSHTHGVDGEGRHSNAMQTQTLIMPYTENNPSTENREEFRPDGVPVIIPGESINDNDVDHRFLSEADNEESKRNQKEEEAKVGKIGLDIGQK